MIKFNHFFYRSISIGCALELLKPFKIIIFGFSFQCYLYLLASSLKILLGIFKLIFSKVFLNQFLPYSEKPEFLPLLGNLIIDH